ncbi:MAG: rod shape-determining protein MreC [Lachnospiraceae bacterium]|nr:rod shape-determining protein MreC [Lachnospiraceae bacterium]
MKRKNKFSMPVKYLLLILSSICIFLCILSFTDLSAAPYLKNITGYVLVPSQQGLNHIGQWFSEKADNLEQLKEVMAENEALRKQNNALMEENSRLALERTELEELRQIYKLDETYDYPKIMAKVIGKDPGNWFQIFQIDKGSADGIKVDMNVISGNGLVGIVTSVSEHSAVVRSIIDDSSNVSAEFSLTSDICNVAGDLSLMNEGKIRVEDISKDAGVEPGNTVVTSHISTKFLPGILIGYVSDISIDANNLTKSGYVTPVVDFEHLTYVLVITELKQK